MGAYSKRRSSSGTGDDIPKHVTEFPKGEASLTKGMFVISILRHHIIKIFKEVLAPDEPGVNSIKFYSMVLPPGIYTPIITQLMSNSKGDVDDCQEFLVVGKDFIRFLLEE